MNAEIKIYLKAFLLALILCTKPNTSNAKRNINHQSISTAEIKHPKQPALIEVPIQNGAIEHQSDYWYKNAQTYLNNKLQESKATNKEISSTKRAKNIIIFMGDGMSLPTVTATRKFIKDAAYYLPFERFPHFGLTKTYCVDSQVPDSAASSTAYLSGVKANYGTIGVNAQVPRFDCKRSQQAEYQTESIAKWAQDSDKWTGFVTTARVTHASPAGLYAHVANRRWEYDGKIETDNCSSTEILDIARQLVELPIGQKLRVIMGGGSANFLDKSMRDEFGEQGKRTDRRNLIQHWLDQKANQNLTAKYVWHKRDLMAMDLKDVDYLLGLFSASHMPYHGDLKRFKLKQKIPSLSEMTRAAIKLLARAEQGYFLFVEGARIDMAHHDTRARLSLEETAEFGRAVEVALNMTSKEETLIVVIADHAHTMTINGYANHNADILGLNTDNALDNLPYTILSYANGPGYSKTYTNKGRKDLSKKDFNDPRRRYMATVPLESETHGGDDTGVFALGPYAEIFSGNYEQSYLPLLMAKAAAIGTFS